MAFMSREIKEPDWKVFRQLHPIAVERFCERVLLEIERIKADETKSCHERYLDVFELFMRRDKEIAQTFNDFRRSTALVQLAAIHSRNLLTNEEFSRFSPETRNVVERLVGLTQA